MMEVDVQTWRYRLRRKLYAMPEWQLPRPIHISAIVMWPVVALLELVPALLIGAVLGRQWLFVIVASTFAQVWFLNKQEVRSMPLYRWLYIMAKCILLEPRRSMLISRVLPPKSGVVTVTANLERSPDA